MTWKNTKTNTASPLPVPHGGIIDGRGRILLPSARTTAYIILGKLKTGKWNGRPLALLPMCCGIKYPTMPKT